MQQSNQEYIEHDFATRPEFSHIKDRAQRKRMEIIEDRQYRAKLKRLKRDWKAKKGVFDDWKFKHMPETVCACGLRLKSKRSKVNTRTLVCEMCMVYENEIPGWNAK